VVSTSFALFSDYFVFKVLAFVFGVALSFELAAEQLDRH
jgi:hypothetical protein